MKLLKIALFAAIIYAGVKRNNRDWFKWLSLTKNENFHYSTHRSGDKPDSYTFYVSFEGKKDTLTHHVNGGGYPIRIEVGGVPIIFSGSYAHQISWKHHGTIQSDDRQITGDFTFSANQFFAGKPKVADFEKYAQEYIFKKIIKEIDKI